MGNADYAKILDDISEFIDGDISVLDEDREKVSRDASLFYIKPEIVVYPKHKDDISKLLAYVSGEKDKKIDLSIAMRAAGTCMTGGSLCKSIVVDATRYMNKVVSVDEISARVEPGVYYRDFEKETLKKGWIMPSYPASRELSAMGGIVSNNSGGEKTLVYGKTEKYVKSLDIIFANGEKDTIRPLNIYELQVKMKEATESGRIHKEVYNLITENIDEIETARPSVSKNSSGYLLWNVLNKETREFDMTKLIVGSQGTLACVSEATITGVKPKSHSRMLVMFLPTTKKLGEIIPRMLLHNPETFESYDDHTFKIALKFFKDIAKRMGGTAFNLAFQFIPEFWMLITGGVPKLILMAEFTGDSEEEVETKIKNAYEDLKSFNYPLKRAHSEKDSQKYWTFRRESFNLLRSKLKGYRTAPTIDDIIVHPKDLPEFLPRLDKIFAKYDKDLVYTIAGHMGDANFHIIPLIDIHKDGIIEVLHNLMDEVFGLVFEYKGSMSAEHNDGLLRTAYLPKMFSPEMIRIFEKTKNIFDPKGILNPMKKVGYDKSIAWKFVDKK
ncbi:MAG: putative oxidoreductase [Candidatus Nomurabacteria bacterium]|nr:putative oxidoreductase [Candidatus Nomurabacteria bacterium]